MTAVEVERSAPPCVARFATQRTDRPTAGDEAARIAETIGTPLLPWQRQVLDVALEYEIDGSFPLERRFAYREIAFGTPRQSGKSVLLLVKFMHRLVMCGNRQSALYSMQTGTDAARKLLDDWAPEIMESPLQAAFGETKQALRRSVGSERIKSRNGSTLEVLRNTKDSGHGRTIDEAALDEVMADIDDRREQAVIPAMLTRPNAQLMITSTAGTDESLYWRRKVDLGREMVANGVTEDVAYFEWSADDGADPYDEDVWWSCMPALGHTQSISAVRHAAKTMTEHEFRRAMLNQWTRMDDKVIDYGAWVECRSTHGSISESLVLSIDVNKDRTAATIVAASRGSDGLIDVELIEQHEGINWIVPRLRDLQDRHTPWKIMVDGAGPAGALIPEMEREGLMPAIVKGADIPKACGFLYDQIMERNLRVRPNEMLDDAVAGAAKRVRGDQFVWQRSTVVHDIHPLYAMTLAVWGIGGEAMGDAVWLF